MGTTDAVTVREARPVAAAHPGPLTRLVAAVPGRGALALALLAASATTVLGMAGSVWAFPAGAACSAVLGVATGLVLLHQRGGLAVRAMGAAVALWAAGQTWIAALVLRSPGLEQHPTHGDLLQTAAAPLALLAVLALPRPTGFAGRRRQLVLDGAVVAAAGASVLWRAAFVPLDPAGAEAVTAAVVVLADLAVLALCLQLAVASLDRGAALVAGGLALFVVTDLANTHELVQPGDTWPWLGAAAACAAWPLVSAGFLTAGHRRLTTRGTTPRSADLRTGALTGGVLVAAVVFVLVVSALGHYPRDTVSGVLGGLVLVALVTRELVHRRQRDGLLDDLRQQALLDPLTGLANRSALVAALAEHGRAGREVAVVVLDVDGFKQLNQQFGHAAGDALLQVLGSRLERAVPAGWSAHHLGGDDFAVVGGGDLQRGVEVAALASGALGEPVELPAGVDAGLLPGQVADHRAVATVVATSTTGVASTTPSLLDPASCVADATTAMRTAKTAGRGRTAVHDDAARERSARRTLVGERLQVALRCGAVTAALQPLVDITSGRATGFEALARWDDEVLGTVRPDEFVAVAEEVGAVPALGAAVLRAGLESLVAVGGVERGLRLSVNASPVELRGPGYVDGVLHALLQAGVPVDLLTVEVTEGVFMTADDPAVAALEALGAAGTRVAVDDFGTGYSSLSYLERLPVHVVKIDRSLVCGLERPRPRAVLRAVVELCRALDLHVVAEGVETREQADALAALGVVTGQGWLWARALDLPQVRELLAAQDGAADPALRTVPAPRAPHTHRA